MLEHIVQFWEFALIILVVLLEVITRWADKNRKTKNKFEYQRMPAMIPVPIPTKGNGLFEGFWVWLTKPREWELTEDFHFTLNEVDYIVPKGFVTDGSSVPRALYAVVSPTGILLMGGVVHDYGYMHTTLKIANGEDTERYTQKHLDQIFRDINIQVNGFKAINYLAYYMLRLFGWYSWIKHRKNDKKWDKA